MSPSRISDPIGNGCDVILRVITKHVMLVSLGFLKAQGGYTGRNLCGARCGKHCAWWQVKRQGIHRLRRLETETFT